MGYCPGMQPRITTPVRLVLQEFLKDPDAELYARQIQNETNLGPGTLQPILVRLKGHGWLTVRKEAASEYDGARPPRNYYSLTSNGWEAARQAVRTPLS